LDRVKEVKVQLSREAYIGLGKGGEGSAIKGGRIPIVFTRPKNVWELFEFLVSKGAHCDVWQTTPDVDGDDVTVWCSESLSTTVNLNGMIIDVVPHHLS
jgi:hypothetical protein